jgi:TonB family protein
MRRDVRLQGRIGTDGSFKELWVQQSAGSAADQAALEAVREWKFTETLLNCTAVEVPMTVNVTFERQ